MLSQLGRPEDGTDPTLTNNLEFFVRLKPPDAWPAGVRDARRRRSTASNRGLAEIPGLEVNFSQPIRDNVNENISGQFGQIAVKIYGDDLHAAAGSRRAHQGGDRRGAGRRRPRHRQEQRDPAAPGRARSRRARPLRARHGGLPARPAGGARRAAGRRVLGRRSAPRHRAALSGRGARRRREDPQAAGRRAGRRHRSDRDAGARLGRAAAAPRSAARTATATSASA